MFRSRSWFGGFWKPKNPHSLEHLKYLYNVLSKNQNVSENNRGLLVETLRSIAEILIWGDQNDSSVFDFFLEKNMLSYFLWIMKQKCGSYVCVQLLQTLNILFENIRNETSLYYLLSNNHVNSIIVHKFDFSDEEVMAYYISFLKTLSLKLNTHTIHFFYNEHTNDFPLYTEAIKFFNHSEGMVRIAVRTLTLNVYRVEDESMLGFIRDKTAAPYFSNLVWFIGNHIYELDTCVRNDADHRSKTRLSDLVAEHLDHLHYLNDIFCLNIKDLNQVLSQHLLHKLLIPLYVYSLIKHKNLLYPNQEDRKYVSVVVSLFLLSQVFLIISHRPLVRTLAAVIVKSRLEVIKNGVTSIIQEYADLASNEIIASSPVEENLKPPTHKYVCNELYDVEERDEESNGESCSDSNGECKIQEEDESNQNLNIENPSTSFDADSNILKEGIKKNNEHLNVTDEEKEQRLAKENPLHSSSAEASLEALSNKPFLETILNSLNCTENDYASLFALSLLYAIAGNQDAHAEKSDNVLMPFKLFSTDNVYNEALIERIIQIITLSCQMNTKVRLVTLELAVKMLLEMLASGSLLLESHLNAIKAAKEQSASLLRNFYKSEDIFLDMFEYEYSEVQSKPLNVEWLMMDSNVLLPPTGTPMTGIEFSKRLPCGEVERARRAIRVFFLIRDLWLTLNMEEETHLPLTNPTSYVEFNNVLDLNNSDLIACTVVWNDGQKIRRFLVIDVIQLILVEPDSRKLGWGVAKFVGFLQDIEVQGDKDDSRCLLLTIYKPLGNSTSRVPLLSAKFIFDDHIRCMAAKQRLTKGRIKARQKKMNQIARLLDIPTTTPPSSATTNYSLVALRDTHSTGRGQRHKSQPRPMFTVNKVPGFAAQMRENAREKERAPEVVVKNRDSSPKMPRPRSEEIPLENIRLFPKIESVAIYGENSSASRKRSEETSFTSTKSSESRARRKGQVETV